MITKVKGQELRETYAKKASTAIALNCAVEVDTNGFLVPATGSGTVVGINKREVASTDDDYAENTHIPVEVCNNRDVMEVDTSATPSQANVGKVYDFSSGGLTLDMGSTGTQAEVVGLSSGDKVFVKLAQ